LKEAVHGGRNARKDFHFAHGEVSSGGLGDEHVTRLLPTARNVGNFCSTDGYDTARCCCTDVCCVANLDDGSIEAAAAAVVPIKHLNIADHKTALQINPPPVVHSGGGMGA